ncbi:MAG: NADH-ubiquinone oxidoreductase-F iron-sulfur binding region domain-containing protein [Ilumatobacteraceae bacterium]
MVGEETALIESLEGKRGEPRLKPPFFPAAIGLYGQPTIVNNVETLSNLPWLLVNGMEAYTAIGTQTSPGTRMVAVSGHVNRPGVYEIVNGTTTFRDLLYGDEFCQGIRNGNELKAFVPGGGSAPWFTPEQLDLPFEGRLVGAAGSMLGSGAIMVMDHTTDIPAAALTLTHFYAAESCGQCTPCREGGTWLERVLSRIVDGNGTPADLDQLLEIGESICPGAFPHASSSALGLEATPFPYKMTTICFVGPSAYAPVHSALTLFRSEFEAKITRRNSIPVTAVHATPKRLEPTDDRHRERGHATDRRRAGARPERRTDHGQRRRPHGAQGPVGDRGSGRRRRLHPTLLLPRADDARRQVPDVPRRGRQRPRARRDRVVHGAGDARHEGGDRVADGEADAGRCARAPARQPSARLPGLRQGR